MTLVAKTGPKFHVADKVRKCTGDYHLEGIIVSVFWTTSMKLRYVVEHTPLAPGLLHIYSESNLEAVNQKGVGDGTPT